MEYEEEENEEEESLLTVYQFQKECEKTLHEVFGRDVAIFFDGVNEHWHGCDFETDNFSGEISYYLVNKYFGMKVGEFTLSMDGPYDDSHGKNLRNLIIKTLKVYKRSVERELNNVRKLLKRVEEK